MRRGAAVAAAVWALISTADAASCPSGHVSVDTSDAATEPGWTQVTGSTAIWTVRNVASYRVNIRSVQLRTGPAETDPTVRLFWTSGSCRPTLRAILPSPWTASVWTAGDFSSSSNASRAGDGWVSLPVNATLDPGEHMGLYAFSSERRIHRFLRAEPPLRPGDDCGGDRAVRFDCGYSQPVPATLADGPFGPQSTNSDWNARHPYATVRYSATCAGNASRSTCQCPSGVVSTAEGVDASWALAEPARAVTWSVKNTGGVGVILTNATFAAAPASTEPAGVVTLAWDFSCAADSSLKRRSGSEEKVRSNGDQVEVHSGAIYLRPKETVTFTLSSADKRVHRLGGGGGGASRGSVVVSPGPSGFLPIAALDFREDCGGGAALKARWGSESCDPEERSRVPAPMPGGMIARIATKLGVSNVVVVASLVSTTGVVGLAFIGGVTGCAVSAKRRRRRREASNQTRFTGMRIAL